MNVETKKPAYILPVIVFAQFAGTSLWFAGNAVIQDLRDAFGLGAEALGDLTAAVQLGFIAGTFFFALLSVADRFSPSRVFLFSAFMGAFFNLCVSF
ncbi:MAG: MFS transporter, partial [Saprospiraceae bacterium]|nr:MFS transporter [Saprospiraceae bacterium]